MMSSGNPADTGMKYLLTAAAHTEEKAIARNPFDEQFSQASRYKITRFSTTNNIGSSSPLNTPSISLTDSTYIPALTLDLTTSLQTPYSSVPDSAIEYLRTPKFPEAKISENTDAESNNNNNHHHHHHHHLHHHDHASGDNNHNDSTTATTTSSSSTTAASLTLTSLSNANSLKPNSIVHLRSSPVISVPEIHNKSPKSNAVSVICQSSKPLDNNNDNEHQDLSSKAHISPKFGSTTSSLSLSTTTTAAAAAAAAATTNNTSLSISSSSSLAQSQFHLKTTYIVSNPLLSGVGNGPIFTNNIPTNGALGPLFVALPSQSDASNHSLHSNSSQNSLPGMINDCSIDSGPRPVKLANPTSMKKKNNNNNNNNKKPSPGTGHRKEKTVEEMLKKIRDTEEALPPKAKPGRKSKGSVEDESDQKERKKRSLERNRAAAMRCRLKKKKEVNSLKQRCDNYEMENEKLLKLVQTLQEEVYNLKSKLLAKNCSC